MQSSDHLNELERKLMLAAAAPVARPDFYRTLLASTIFAIGFMEGAAEEGMTAIPAGAEIKIVDWEKTDGTRILPFFTSLDALVRAVKVETRYISMPARSFFEMTQGWRLALNPLSLPHGREFSPEEIRVLLETGTLTS